MPRKLSTLPRKYFLCAFAKYDVVFLLSTQQDEKSIIKSTVSRDAFSFQEQKKGILLAAELKDYELTHASHFSTTEGDYFLIKKKISRLVKQQICTLDSRNILRPKEAFEFTNENGCVVSDFKYAGQYVMYYGERSIKVAYSKNLKKWVTPEKPVLFDARPLEIAFAAKSDDGILVAYLKKQVENSITHYEVYLALFDEESPDKIIWKSEEPIWKQKDHWPHTHVQHLGMIFHKKRLMSYWHVSKKIVCAVVHTGFTYHVEHIKRFQKKIRLEKHESNPIIAPKAENDWEAFNTFNPAAVNVGGKVHILYRAQGFDYISSVGYASSVDGITIDERLNGPIYTPFMDFENNVTKKVNKNFVSGGGYGGCEDPRVTLLGDRVYMTYVAFDGWSPPRLALTSIFVDDFLKKRWLWSRPVLISPPNVVDKSGCLLPEKIDGKYVFFHRIFPNILIDFVDELNFDGKSKWLKGQYQIKVRDTMWDSRKIGAGAPPLRTKDGWLLIYYGVDDKDAGKYHIGAMLLDLKDPTQVLHRSNHPILEPTEIYENTGFKPGVAYPCGAVIVKDQLLVYYGGADSVVCVAKANLEKFLHELKTTEEAHLKPVQIHEISL